MREMRVAPSVPARQYRKRERVPVDAGQRNAADDPVLPGPGEKPVRDIRAFNALPQPTASRHARNPGTPSRHAQPGSLSFHCRRRPALNSGAGWRNRAARSRRAGTCSTMVNRSRSGGCQPNVPAPAGTGRGAESTSGQPSARARQTRRHEPICLLYSMTTLYTLYTLHSRPA